MKQIIRRVASSGMAVRGRFKVGCDCFDLVDNGNNKLLLNGYETVTCGGAGISTENLAIFLSDMLSRVPSTGSDKIVVTIEGGSDDLMRLVAQHLSAKLGEKSVAMSDTGHPGDLKVSPAKHKVDGTVNFEAVAKNASVLACKISKVASAISSAHDAALMMTRKRLVDTMWGAKAIQSILDSVKQRIDQPVLPWSRVAASADVVAKSASRLLRKISSNDVDDRRMVTNVLIPGINDGYTSLKTAAEMAVMSFVPLVHIDVACKESTTYPATWFFDENIIDGVSQGYNGILDFLVQVPAMEAKVVDPLSSIKMRINNSLK